VCQATTRRIAIALSASKKESRLTLLAGLACGVSVAMVGSNRGLMVTLAAARLRPRVLPLALSHAALMFLDSEHRACSATFVRITPDIR
jgi:hypothetical protein